MPAQSQPAGDPPAIGSSSDEPDADTFRRRLWRIVFLSDTFTGRLFDIALLILIAICVFVVMLSSVESLQAQYGRLFFTLEWTFTLIFTVEYLTRVWVAPSRRRYITSFFGLVDLVSILPSYLELLFAGSHYLMTVRVLRLVRMFRILKMAEHVGEAHMLVRAMRGGRHKIIVFLTSVIALVCVEGTMIYVLEHDKNPGFSNIPQSIYWAIVTLTTVGYGDVTPVTIPGKLMASVIMLTGFAIIAVPTGVMTAEISREMRLGETSNQKCPNCGWQRHDVQARFCQQCGQQL